MAALWMNYGNLNFESKNETIAELWQFKLSLKWNYGWTMAELSLNYGYLNLKWNYWWAMVEL